MSWKLALTLNCLLVATVMADGPLGAFPPAQEVELPLEQSFPAEEMTVRIYPVADLILSTTSQVTSSGPTKVETSPTPGPSSPQASETASPLEAMAELSVIVQSVISPASWEMAGGTGHLTVHGPTQSLIVRQSTATHQAIDDLLTNLRRTRDVGIQLTVRCLTPVDGERSVEGQKLLEAVLDEHDQVMDVEATRLLVARLDQPSLWTTTRRAQLASGGSATILEMLRCTAAVTPDRRAVQLQLGVATASTDAGGGWTQLGHYRVANQQTVAVSCDVPGGSPCLVLISVHLAIPSEEEEMLAPVEEVAGTQQPPAMLPAHVSPATQVCAADARHDLRTMAYPLADLIAPMVAHLPAEKVDWDRELDQFAIMLARKTGAEHWRNGETVSPQAGRRTLVIRQTQPVHAQIANFLAELRSAPRSTSQAIHQPLVTPIESAAAKADNDAGIQPVRFETSSDSPPKFQVILYPVADLIAAASSRGTAERVDPQFEMQRFAASTARMLGSQHWGDGASIAAHAGSLLLVVRQTPANHQRLADLLQQLRRAGEATANVTIRRLSDGTALKDHPGGVIDAKQTLDLIERATDASTAIALSLDLVQSPTDLREMGIRRLTAVPTIDNSRVLLEVIGPEGVLGQAEVPVGGSLVLAGRDDAETPPLLITVDQVHNGVEEPALLGIPTLD
jgi:hypothetical protein